MSSFAKKIQFSVGASLIVFSAYSQAACDPTDAACKGKLKTRSDSLTNLSINLGVNTLSAVNGLSALNNIVVPVSQVNSGDIKAVTRIVAPSADYATATATAIGNAVNLSIDQKATVVSNQFNTGSIAAVSHVNPAAGIGGGVKEKLEISATAFGNVFSSSLYNKGTDANSFAAVINQCNQGNAFASAAYNIVDPKTLNVTSTAIGNAANITNMGMAIAAGR